MNGFVTSLSKEMTMNKIMGKIALLAVGFAFPLTDYAQSFLTNGLVAYYPLDGDARDASGNGLNGTVVGGTATTADRFGVAGHAFLFQGGLGSVELAGLPVNSQDGATNTLSLWFNWTGQFYSPTDTGVSIFDWASGPTYNLYIQQNSNPSVVRVGIGDGYGDLWGITVGAAFLTNTWIHLVAEFVNGDVTNALVFINGKPSVCFPTVVGVRQSFSQTRAVGSSAVISGVLFSQDRYRMFGGIDDVRIYNHPLSSAEIQQLYLYEAPSVLNVEKAVYLDSPNLRVGTNYQIQISADLINWTNYGPVFTATNSVWRSPGFWDVNNWAQLFFRFRQVP
jgi:hypothetical protein